MTALRPVRRSRHLRAVPDTAVGTSTHRLRAENQRLRDRVGELEAMLHDPAADDLRGGHVDLRLSGPGDVITGFAPAGRREWGAVS